MYSAAEGGLRKVWEDCPRWAVNSRTHPRSGRGEMSSGDPGGRVWPERLEEGRHPGEEGGDLMSSLGPLGSFPG